MGIRNASCDLCSFGISCATAPKNPCLVPAESDIKQCDVMIIAEQPYKQDDMYGQIFSSSSLSSIKKIFEDAGLSVYSTYAVKCPRPDKKTKPEIKHLKACGPEYLAKELAIVKPKHIIALGSNAFYAVKGKAPGKTFPTGGRYFDKKLDAYLYPTVHPLQAAYQIQYKAQLTDDCHRFVGWITGANKNMDFCPPVYVADTLKSLRIMQKRIREAGGICAVDTETMGLNPYKADKHVRTIQFCWDEEFGGVVVPMHLEPDCYYTQKSHLARFWQDGETLDEAVEIIREILLTTKCIWHNGKFDRLWLHEWGKREFGAPILAPHIYMDTLHVAHAINENRSLKLKRLITEEFDFITYDIADKLTKNLDLLIPYGGRDTVADLMLAKKYAAYLTEPGNEKLKRRYTKITKPMDAKFTEIELRGWPIDAELVAELEEVVETELAEIDGKMRAMLAEQDIEIEPKAFTSNAKLAVILFDKLGFPMSKDKSVAYTKSKERATNKDALVHLRKEPFVVLLNEFKQRTKELNTYIRPIHEEAISRGRISTSYKLHGTKTGRTSSGKDDEKSVRKEDEVGTNLQNLPYYKYGPKKLSVRKCIKAREGWSIMEADFSQVELRIAGELSKDPLFITSYQEDRDIHALRAMRLSGHTPESWAALPDEVRKDLRGKAKAVNFGFVYGMQVFKFQQYALTDYDVDFSIKECTKIREQFFHDHAGLERWYVRQEREALRKGYVESLSGHRRHLPNIMINPDDGRDAKMRYAEAVRMSVNTPVQGFASDLKLMSMIEIDDVMDSKIAILFGEVHDSVLLEVRNDMIDFVGNIILDIMAHPTLLDVLGIELNIPIKAELKVGKTLGDAKDYVPVRKAA